MSAPPLEEIVAVAAVERAVAVIADDDVVELVAGEVDDVGADCVAGRQNLDLLAGRKAVGEVRIDDVEASPDALAHLIEGGVEEVAVVAAAAAHDVVAGTAVENVVPAETVELIVTVTSRQVIVAAGARHLVAS